jgi:putative toxin-antitoxin system antitoxin component (TIGR02293 family)
VESNKSLKDISEASGMKLYQLNVSTSIVRDVEAYTHINPIRAARILGISKSKYYQMHSEQKPLDLRLLDILSSFLKVWQKGLRTFDNNEEDLITFLNTPNTNLGGSKPIDLLEMETGRNEVSKALDRIEYGIYG